MPLTTYTASAGSGKTYALTREYVRQLLARPNNPAAYRQLLAVTFTNKAADEMKTRIVMRLNQLSEGADPVAEQQFCDELSIHSVTLKERALLLRNAILHDYSHFSVSTIDAFFQKIVRGFLYEMGLQPGFSLELDSERLLDEAVNTLWQDTAVNESLRSRLGRLVNQRLANGQSWNAEQQLKAMGCEVFRESFRNRESDFMGKMGAPEFFTACEKELQTILSRFTDTMQRVGTAALQILSENGFAVTDFKYKSASFATYFRKIVKPSADKDCVPGVRVRDALNKEEKWLTGDLKKDAVIQTKIYPSLNPLLQEALHCYDTHITTCRTAREVLKNLYSMALLADIAEKVTAIANSENLLFINDTLYLLRNLIGHDDTPFVYEKAGVYYHSFMLDEFQDTSSMQWESLRPLLLNGLSEGGNVLAVGDAKQSIYRWRNGDWQILANTIYHDFRAFDVQRIVLDTNWRSREMIVETNNHLFSRLPLLFQQKLNEAIADAAIPTGDTASDLQSIITTAYKEVTQKVAPAKKGAGGYVHIESMEASDERSAKENVLQSIPPLVAALQDRGYAASDIAILVRYGREGQEVADRLLQYKQTSGDTAHCFDVLSPDSLFLQHAPVVQFIISILHCAAQSNDAIHKTCAMRYLQQANTNTQITDYFLDTLLYMSLPEATEKIIAHFHLNENEKNWAFLQEFQDIAATCAAREYNDIYSFLQHWKDFGQKYTLAMADNRNAVRIMTIHKSKGLQFPVAIIPFCSWSIEPKTNSLIWVKTAQPPFAALGYVPLNYTNTLSETLFNKDYWVERAQAAIDNLNLLYVAFTRAEDELYAFIPQPQQKRSGMLAQLLPELLQQEKYIVGQPLCHTAQKNETTGVIKLEKYLSTETECEKTLHVRYVNEHTSDIESAGIRDYGILMHRAFSYIITSDDIEKAVSQLIADGFLANETAQRNTLLQLLKDALSQPGIGHWFDGSWKVFTETDMLLPSEDGEKPVQLRPDRIMMRDGKWIVLDYKFGQNKLPSHKEQIATYVSCLKKMGHRQVEGVCWYVMSKEIILIE